MNMLGKVLRISWFLICLVAQIGKILTKYVYRLLRHMWQMQPTTHGSARWATLGDLTKGKALGGDKGVIVGKSWGQLLRFKRDGAVMVCAPMGKGKGVGVVIPNILDHKGSMVITDPKGENYAVTQRHRSTLGPVYRLDAIQPDQTDSFNPLSMIRVGTYHEADDALQIAGFLVIPEGRDTHWDVSARRLLTAVLRHVVRTRPRPQQTLSHVRELIASGEDGVRRLLEEMAISDAPSIAEEGMAFLAGMETEGGQNVVENAAKAMTFWSSDRVGGRLTCASDFDMMDLHREGMTLYVMVPDDQIEVYAPLLRVIVGCAVAALMRGKDRPRPRYKPMLLIDECRALGRLDALATGMGMLREYCHTILIWQDLGQLAAVYGEDTARTFIAASGAQVSFGVSDGKTARDLAEDIGKTTVYSRSRGSSEGNLDLVRAQLQDGSAEAGRYLKDPAEIRRLDPDKCIVFLQDQVSAPILATKLRYYKELRWKGLWDEWRAPARIMPLPSRGSKGPGSATDLSSAA